MIAFTIEDATALPPFLPILVINGILVIASSFLDSKAETNPTGTPTISAGVSTPSLTILIVSYKAVGALPIATMLPAISLEECRMASSDLVLFRILDSLMTVSFEILHTVLNPSFESNVLFNATFTISTSVTIEHLFLIALKTDPNTSFPKIIPWEPANSKSAVE